MRTQDPGEDHATAYHRSVLVERTQARCDDKTTVAEGQWHSYCRRPLPRHGENIMIKPLESSSNRGEIVVMGR